MVKDQRSLATWDILLGGWQRDNMLEIWLKQVPALWLFAVGEHVGSVFLHVAACGCSLTRNIVFPPFFPFFFVFFSVFFPSSVPGLSPRSSICRLIWGIFRARNTQKTRGKHVTSHGYYFLTCGMFHCVWTSVSEGGDKRAGKGWWSADWWVSKKK